MVVGVASSNSNIRNNVVSFKDAFGFHNSRSLGGAVKPTCWNCLVVGGYIPGVAIIAGVIHLYWAIMSLWHNRETTQHFCWGLIGRGVLECLGAGVLLIILDIFASIKRHC